jgi:hypothetical protein
MRRLALVIAAVAAVTAALNATPAFAQAVRTFVSGHGTDSGTCGVGSPCRTFAYAITQTAPAGEIVVLDSAGYGAVTITQSLTITNPGGVEAGITASSGDAVTVAAGVQDTIALRGLSLLSNGGANGITLTSGGHLIITDCWVGGFSGNGINIQPNNPLPSPSIQVNVTVSRTVVSRNGGNGIYLATALSTLNVTVKGVFDHILAIDNGFGGIVASGGPNEEGVSVSATVTDSIASGNGNVGFLSFSTAGPVHPTMFIQNSKAVGNTFIGVHATYGTIILTQVATFDNGSTGYFVDTSGVIETYGNNYIADANNTGTLTPIAQQ